MKNNFSVLRAALIAMTASFGLQHQARAEGYTPEVVEFGEAGGLAFAADPRLSIAAITAIIIGREVMVSALREWMAEVGNREQVAVTGVAKFKTIAQMFGLSLMLWTQDLFGIPIYAIGTGLMIIAAGLTLWTMVVYVRAAWPYLAGQAELP